MPRPQKIAYLTAGAAGMICGSCLHDNTLARSLIELGHDVQLVPLYTPIRTDEQDVTVHEIFYGGINMYLQQKVPLFRWLPKWLDHWLDQPWLINWAAGRSVKIDPKQVADITLSILRGREGFQRKEVERLVDWLTADGPPDVIVFSNILTAGCVPEIKRRIDVPVVVTLQGDDIFLRGLPEPHHTQALAEIRRLAEQIDGYIAHTHFYAGAMAEYLGLARERIQIAPLGIDVRDFEEGFRVQGSGDRRQETGDREQEPDSNPKSKIQNPKFARPPTVGYLARLAPEKGLHILAEAFLRLRQMPEMEQAKLRIAGWMGKANKAYADEVFAKLREAGLGEAFEYVGEVDRRGKLDFLASIDVLAVPTTYRDPKGLFVLEALAAGVPVVQPEHGSFPEMLGELAGGLLHRPEDPQHLAERLHLLLTDEVQWIRLASSGRQNVHTYRNAQVMAQRTIEALEQIMNTATLSREQTCSR
ncbi:MAG TPA: glycosyltransferase family 4 protein [Pirellulaceae bacterium]|nr:glycosyltransferase family 4 protein [Pirellulaceae bacterium]